MFLIRFGGGLFAAHLLGAIGLLVAIETPFNEAVAESAAWMATPILLLSVAFTKARFIAIHQRTGYSSLKIWLYTILTAGILTMMSWPYVLLANATVSAGTPVVLGGQVVDKFEAGSRSRSFVLVTRPAHSAETVKLTVSEAEYESTRIGSWYSRCFLLGPLNFAYRWRHADTQPMCGA